MDLSAGHGSAQHGSHADGMSMPGQALILDARTGAIQHRLTLPVQNHNVAFSPDGREIWTALMSDSGLVEIFDASDYSRTHTIAVGMMPAEVSFSADGTVAFVANGGSNDISAIRVSDYTVLATIPVGEGPVGAWPGPDNRMYVDNEAGKSISVIDVTPLQVVSTLALGFTPGMAALNSHTGDLWVSDTEHGEVVIFRNSGGAFNRSASIPTGVNAHAIAFTLDGLWAYVTNQGSGTVSVVDAIKLRKVRDIHVGRKPNGLLLRE